MAYVSDLVEHVCGVDGQIDIFMKKVLKNEYDVDNGNPPAGKNTGTGRFGDLQSLPPRYVPSSMSRLQTQGGVSANNNPLYPSNMIDRMNTPFDHVERILLQDFSGVMDIEGGSNYFKKLFKFTPTSHSEQFTNGYNKIELKDAPYYNVEWSGEFFVDSFTYTPFIDYSQTEYEEGGWQSIDRARTGVYADDFLNDYNCCRYNESYTGPRRVAQVDVDRHDLSSNMFALRNLEKDIYEAKIGFRDAIDRDADQDAKVYIYTFCEHLAKLFAKLSNIRMCHEIYGLKHPHRQWEGILALDIWY